MLLSYRVQYVLHPIHDREPGDVTTTLLCDFSGHRSTATRMEKRETKWQKTFTPVSPDVLRPSTAKESPRRYGDHGTEKLTLWTTMIPLIAVIHQRVIRSSDVCIVFSVRLTIASQSGDVVVYRVLPGHRLRRQGIVRRQTAYEMPQMAVNRAERSILV